MVNLPDGEQKEKYVRELFESIAGKYDLMNSVMTFGMDRRWRRFMVKRSGINPRGAALDICCGTGKNTMELARVVGSGGYVTGLDFSPKMLSVARRVAAESNIGQAITYVRQFF